MYIRLQYEIIYWTWKFFYIVLKIKKNFFWRPAIYKMAQKSDLNKFSIFLIPESIENLYSRWSGGKNEVFYIIKKHSCASFRTGHILLLLIGCLAIPMLGEAFCFFTVEVAELSLNWTSCFKKTSPYWLTQDTLHLGTRILCVAGCLPKDRPLASALLLLVEFFPPHPTECRLLANLFYKLDFHTSALCACVIHWHTVTLTSMFVVTASLRIRQLFLTNIFCLCDTGLALSCAVISLEASQALSI